MIGCFDACVGIVDTNEVDSGNPGTTTLPRCICICCICCCIIIMFCRYAICICCICGVMLGMGAMVALLLDKPMDRSGSNEAEDGVAGEAATAGGGGTGKAGAAFMKPNADPGAVDSAAFPEDCKDLYRKGQ